MNEIEFEILKCKTIKSIDGCVNGSECVTFNCTDGTSYRMAHNQDCCETVKVEDVCGYVSELIGSEILQAEKSSNSDNPPHGEYGVPDSFTWTFYRIATMRGQVVIRWLGESNGCYSEGVDFIQIETKTTVTNYFTFGQRHAHSVNGITFDKDVVVKITAPDSEACRQIMFEHFGPKWSTQYDEDRPPNFTLYPRGIVELP